MEVLVVMALSTVVVVTAWAVLGNVTLFAMEHKKRLADGMRLVELDRQLRFDFDNAVDLKAVDDKVCLYGNGAVVLSCYEFSEAQTIREFGGSIDTLMLGTVSWRIDSTNSETTLVLVLGEEYDDQGAFAYSVRRLPTAKEEP